MPVPEVYAVGSDLKCYLLEDLGNITLFDFLSDVREKEGFSETIISQYNKVLKVLPKIQVVAGKNLDYSVLICKVKCPLISPRYKSWINVC